MKWRYILPLLILFGCAGSPLRTAVIAERHLNSMLLLKTGMNEYQVLARMGGPEAVRVMYENGLPYTVYFYLTREALLAQFILYDENFTPFIFDFTGHLIAWGWPQYKYVFDSEYRMKYDERIAEENRRAPNSDTEWITPLLTPPGEQPTAFPLQGISPIPRS